MKDSGMDGRKSGVGTKKKTMVGAAREYFKDVFDRRAFSVKLGGGTEELYPLMSKGDIRHVAKEICRAAMQNAK